MLAFALTVAVVVGDQVSLRATPERTGARQAVLARGDWLEVRGDARRGFVKVYDHRHERPGYVADAQVRIYPADASAAPDIHAIALFLRDTPGQESLGIAYVALYLRVAPAAAIGTDMFDALGTMAERLARTASTRADGAAATHLEVAESYGVHFVSYEASERTRLCYDGEAFRHVLALGGAPTERARAALALTAPECTPPLVGATELGRIEEGRLAILLEVAEAPPAWWSRINVRRAQLGADLAWAFARRGDAKSAQAAADGAVRSLARVDRSELGEEDQAAYRDAALRVAASGWGAEDAAPRKGLGLRAGEPGETCVRWGEAEKCTYGQVWSASFRLGPSGRAALAVEPMPGWLELWLFSGDRVDVLAPSTDSADVGYVELAGFAGDGSRAVVVRESTRGRSFQVVKLDGLLVEHQASTFTGLGGARRWASADWKARTLALR